MRLIAFELANALLAREATLPELVAGASFVLGSEEKWIPPMCESILKRCGADFHSFSRNELTDIIFNSVSFQSAFERGKVGPTIRRYCIDLPVRPPAPQWLASLDLPLLPAAGDLARWLDTPVGALEWFADQWRLTPQRALQHYHYRWIEKRSGGLRLIEIPKQRLHAMQGRILRGMLDLVPAHPAAHGFRRGRSCVSHAALHTGKRFVIRMDLKDFFPSIPASRVHALFAKLGYSDSVAGLLARVCTTRTPESAFGDVQLPWSERHALRSPHLPQGSPCSPALANLCAFRLDIRLDALAASMGARYSRYADDLVFSGDGQFGRALDRFHVRVGAIAIEEGFVLNTRKTRMMRQGVRQEVTGIVVNRHPNVPRAAFDLLKATLTNCMRHGPASQNRENRANFRAYLAGKVSHVSMVNAARGAKLQRLFDAIVWQARGRKDSLVNE